MNAEKLKRLQSQVRIGGKGTARRKKKVMHQTATTDDKKLQSSLKKLSVSTIPGIEEVNIIKDDLTVIHFNNPKAQASLSANTFAVTGHGETKKIVEMLPEILPQLGQETVVQLRMFANSMTGTKKAGGTIGESGDAAASANMLYSVVEEDDVPMLVSDFDEVAKMEAEKVGETAIKTINTEQPASEFEPNKNAAENKKGTVAVLPITTPKETSKAETNDVKKSNEIQPLDNSNLNIKLAEDSKQQVIDEKDTKKLEKSVKKDNLNKNEKSNEKSTKDIGKANEVQKKQEKIPQKQEAAKQKAKSDGKNQKGSKENRKHDETVIENTVKEEKKADESKNSVVVGGETAKPPQVTGSSENVKENKSQQQQTQNQQKQPQAQKQVKSEPTQDKQHKIEKQLEAVTDKQQRKEKQPEQQKNPKQDQKQRQTDLKENKDKQEKHEKSEENSQQTKTIAEPQGQEKQQENILIKPEQQQEKQKEQKQTQALKSIQQQQQQPKREQLNKQKNKQAPQKSQNQDNQKKSEPLTELEKAQLQEVKQQAPQLKPPEEKSTTKMIESNKSDTEEQTADTKQSLREISSNEALNAQPKALSTANDQKQKIGTPPKEDKSEPKKPGKEVPKLESQTAESKNVKNNSPLSEIGAPTKPFPSVADDVSIKTVALQSLESTEKMLQMVNEMTKALPLDNLKTQKNESEKEVITAVLPVEKPKDLVPPPKNLNVVEVNMAEKNTAAPAVETVLNINLKTGDQNQSSQSIEIVKDNKIADSPSQGNISADKELVTGNVQNPSPIQQKVSESVGKINVVEQQTVVSSLLQTTQTSAAPINVPTGDKLPKQPTLAEILQTQPPPAISATAPNLAINTQTVENTPKKDISIAAELPAKQSPLSPQIPPNVAITLPSIPAVAGEIKDKPITETLIQEDVNEDKLSSTAPPATEVAKAMEVSKTAEVKAATPKLPTPTDDKTRLQSNDKTLPVSPKQKVSPPKQTSNTKATQESSKQQTKPLSAGETAKTPSDTKLKLVTKPQPGQQQQQQQQQQQKTKPKPTNNNKSTPTTPTTPTKTSPEKSTPSPKSTTPNTKPASEASIKKANSPQKQQQTDGAAKSKPAPLGAGGKARPGPSNAASAPVGAKKANTPPSSTNKINPSAGGKQQDTAQKATPANTPAAPEQSKTSATPATENTTAEQPTASK